MKSRAEQKAGGIALLLLVIGCGGPAGELEDGSALVGDSAPVEQITLQEALDPGPTTTVVYLAQACERCPVELDAGDEGDGGLGGAPAKPPDAGPKKKDAGAPDTDAGE
jgi:hypothetical protein